MNTIDQLNARISELADIVLSLAVSVKYRDDEPLQAFLAENLIGGRRRVAVNLALAAIMARATGEKLPGVPHISLLREYPVLEQAFRDEPISLDHALPILAEILGSPEQARALLRVHRDRGLSPDGHAALAM